MKISVKAGLALAVSAAFVATSVAPAFAASQVDFSGYYRAQFYTYGNALGIHNSDQKKSDSWFKNRFRLNMDIQATDEISIHARWQGPKDKKWGQGNGNAEVAYAYGQVKQDWGTILVGNMPDNEYFGHAGLKNLGWDPTTVDGDEANYRPFDTGDGGDGIAYGNTWDNGFTLYASYEKVKADNDRFKDGDFYADQHNGNDRDWDRGQVEGIYRWDTGAASMAVAYDRDARGDTDRTPDRDYATASVWYINPAFMQSFGAFSAHAEAMFGFGKYNLKDKDWAALNKEKPEDKISGQGFYLDFDYNYGPGRVNLAGWWTSGNEYDKDGKTGKQKALPDGMGKGFNPLLVLYQGGGLQTANEGQGGLGQIGNYESWRANHWAIDLNGQHAFTDEITARWAIAYAALNKATRDISETPGKVVDQDKDLGWEIDLGLEAEILDNLHLYSGFGYLFAGDAFKMTEKDDPDDGYAWINTLYFNF